MPSEAVRAQWAALRFDEAAYLGDIGLSVPSGERDHPALERLWARPTADINGIWGGYTGAGAKTVIASEAFAKLSFRLVPGQDQIQKMISDVGEDGIGAISFPGAYSNSS